MKKLLCRVLFAFAPVVSLFAGEHTVHTLDELQCAINKAAKHADHETTITIGCEIVGLVTVPTTKHLIILEGKQGKNATLNGDQQGTTLTVDFGAKVELKYLTITNGFSTDRERGGGILNLGTLRLNKCTVCNSKNVAQYGYGGGIHNKNVMVIENSSITSNSSQYYGGGIFNPCPSQMQLKDSKVFDNRYDNIFPPLE